MKTRKIIIILTEENGSFGYQIKVNKSKPLGIGMFYKTALSAYNEAINQLKMNDITFPIDCPRYNMSEEKEDEWITEQIRLGNRPK